MKKRLVDYQSKRNAAKRLQFLAKDIRIKVLKRDDYCCGLCDEYFPPTMNKFLDKKEYALEIHHIIPIRKFEEFDDSLFWDLDNLITLCKHCHSKKVTGSEEMYIDIFKQKIEER